ncbi:YozQ family protein [Paenibacillus sp. HJGM_3]|uniref:YozQ family protein n=1 Tax=Paenibacillus sp. HJGM_3 TaxID=3379816 RepID=UPI00385F923C
MHKDAESNKSIEQSESREGLLNGTEITQEQVSDVYAAGTSDGVHHTGHAFPCRRSPRVASNVQTPYYTF